VTPREFDVLRLLALDLAADREIGEKRFVSSRTVDGHVPDTHAKRDIDSPSVFAARH
jgi:DNA-binding CsgD family transcriptional regulator